MLSEKLLKYKNFEVNFFTELTVSDEYEKWLNYFVQVADDFIKTQFSIDMPFILNLNLIDSSEMQEINLEHRGKDKDTDVLSFPLQVNLRKGDYDAFMPEIELGDLFICKEVCEAQAAEFNITYFEEFIHLCVHGFLHVCGYDHEISLLEEELMESLEKKLLEQISQIKKGA